jgi:hypothetical protein
MAYVKLTSGAFKPCPKPEKIIKEKKAYTFKKKPTGEKELFETIWEQRGPYSEISGQYLGEFNVCYFMHILPKAKNKYPHFKLNPDNIVLGTLQEHFNFDNARHKCTGPEWQKIFDKEAELKEEYKFLYPSK